MHAWWYPLISDARAGFGGDVHGDLFRLGVVVVYILRTTGSCNARLFPTAAVVVIASLHKDNGHIVVCV